MDVESPTALGQTALAVALVVGLAVALVVMVLRTHRTGVVAVETGAPRSTRVDTWPASATGRSAMVDEEMVCMAPPHENIWLWRYMDFWKFVSLVMRQELWFPRPDKLGDPWEGSYGRLNEKEPLRNVRSSAGGSLEHLTPEQIALITDFQAARREATWEDLKRFWGVSCWHHNKVESAAMWAIYGRAGAEIAVRSTYARLRDSLKHGADLHIVICKVSYEENYEELFINTPRPWSTLQHKRQSFEHEHEYRAIAWERDKFAEERIDDSSYDPGAGFSIPVDLDRLIDRVFVSPTTPKSFRTLVEDFCQEHGIAPDRVETSELGDDRRPIR